MRKAIPWFLALGTTLAATSEANAAPRYVDRAITLPRLVFAGDAGVGIGHRRLFDGVTGVGFNLEGAIGITDTVELGLRTGVRVGSFRQRAVGADAYGRTLWTETWGVNADGIANPEFRIRWAAYSGSVAEVGLDGRVFLPIEDGSRFGMMFGVPLAFHIGSIVRIDTGVYLPIVFYPDPPGTFTAISIPGYFWFQVSEKLWLGPMAGLRFVDVGDEHRGHLLLGFGLGYQVASAVDLKTQIFFPQVNTGEGARAWGAGFGVQFRIGE